MSGKHSLLNVLPREASASTRLASPEIGQERWIDYKQPKLDADKVCLALNSHKSFELQHGYAVSDLPKFGDFGAYNGMSEEDEFHLWELEALRLVKIANSEEPVQLQCHEDMFGPAVEQGYLSLHLLGRKLIHAFNVCLHDVSIIQAEHSNSQRSFRESMEAQTKLLSSFDPVTGDERYSKPLGKVGMYHFDHRCYHAVVNYLTAIVMRTVLQTIRGDYWVNNLVATIAKIAAKVKVLGGDLPKAVEQSLQNSREVRTKIQQREKRNNGYKLKNEDYYKNLVDNNPKGRKKNTTNADEMGPARKYFVEMDILYSTLISTMRLALRSFAINDVLLTDMDSFQSSMALYESFITDEQVLLCEDRADEIGAASHAGLTQAATAAFQLCLKQWEAMARDHTSGKTPEWCSIRWKWTRVDEQTGNLVPGNRQGTIKLHSMKNVIAAAVPYAMLTGSVVASMQGLIDLFLFQSGSANRSPVFLIKQPKVIGTAVWWTSKYESMRPSVVGNADACPVSETYMFQKKAIADFSTLSHPIIRDRPKRIGRGKAGGNLWERDSSKDALENMMSHFNKWTIHDDTIVVPSKLYAWGSLAACGLLVVGGIALGFSVGDRITGVDPSNISVFCWVLAGFIILILKATRVENWPWSRFLRGQVPCRSISEVIAVTGVDPQILLAVLLRLDNRMHLRTRGPFNGFFRLRSEGGEDGFSIDVPTKISSAVEGGLIPVKVLTDYGPGLIFIRAHSWAMYGSVTSTRSYDDHVVCRDVLHPIYWNGDTKTPCYRLSRGKVYINSVLGVYNEDCYFY